MWGRRSLRDASPRGASSSTTPRRDISPGTPSGFPCSRIRACSDRLHDPSPSRPPILRMHQPFIHMMQRSGDRNSCGYAGGPQSFTGIRVPASVMTSAGPQCHSWHRGAQKHVAAIFLEPQHSTDFESTCRIVAAQDGWTAKKACPESAADTRVPARPQERSQERARICPASARSVLHRCCLSMRLQEV